MKKTNILDFPTYVLYRECNNINEVKNMNKLERHYCAVNSNTPGEVLSFLSKDTNLDVKAQVAQNKNTPVETLKYLSHYNGYKGFVIRASIATNPSTPIEIVQQLTKDKRQIVRDFAREVLYDRHPDVLNKKYLDEITNKRASLTFNRLASKLKELEKT